MEAKSKGGVTEQVATAEHPRVFRIPEATVEAFPYGGYDIEIHTCDDGSVRLTARLCGCNCLDGWFFSPTDWTVTIPPSAAHHVSYRTREYLKQQALKRITKEQQNEP